MHLVSNLTVTHHTVGGFNETEGVDASEGSQRTDQTNVWAFRRFDGAHTSVVRGVNVTHLHTGALTAQTTGAKGRQAALVGQTSQRVVLVHELTELRSTEELLDSGSHRTDVDQGVGGDGLSVLGGHALTHLTLHTAHTSAHLRLDELTDGADAAVTEVVDVVVLNRDVNFFAVAEALDCVLVLVQSQQVLDGGVDVLDAQYGLTQVSGDTQLLVDLVATNLS